MFNSVSWDKYQMVGKKTIIIATALLIAVIIISSFVYLNSKTPNNGKLESINVAYSPFESQLFFGLLKIRDSSPRMALT